MLDKLERTIRVLEVEAEMHEAQAKRYADPASYLSPSDHKSKLEALSQEAMKKSVAIRSKISLIRRP